MFWSLQEQETLIFVIYWVLNDFLFNLFLTLIYKHPVYLLAMGKMLEQNGLTIDMIWVRNGSYMDDIWIT